MTFRALHTSAGPGGSCPQGHGPPESGAMFPVFKRSLRFVWGLILWMLSIGRARHPGPCTSSYPSGFSIEFLNVGGWLSRGDLALESKAHFLAVAEHRLVPARARNVITQLRKARRSSVWAPSCQDVTPGGHAGGGVISLHGAHISLPTLFDPSFKEFFRIGRAMRVILPLGNGGVVHLFVIYGYQGAGNDPEKLQLTDHLFAAVLAEARMCCCGQPVILAGDFNADPIVIPSLAKGISDGQWVDLERAFALVEEFLPLLLVNSNLMKIKVLVGIFFWLVLLPWLLPLPVMFRLIAGLLLIFLFLRSLLSLLGMLLLSGLGRILLFGLLAGFSILIALVLLRPLRFVIFGMFTFEKLALFLLLFVSNFLVFVTPLM